MISPTTHDQRGEEMRYLNLDINDDNDIQSEQGSDTTIKNCHHGGDAGGNRSDGRRGGSGSGEGEGEARRYGRVRERKWRWVCLGFGCEFCFLFRSSVLFVFIFSSTLYYYLLVTFLFYYPLHPFSNNVYTSPLPSLLYPPHSSILPLLSPGFLPPSPLPNPTPIPITHFNTLTTLTRAKKDICILNNLKTNRHLNNLNDRHSRLRTVHIQ